MIRNAPRSKLASRASSRAVVMASVWSVIGYRCPNRPWGRIMRTIAMITKITVFDASG